MPGISRLPNAKSSYPEWGECSRTFKLAVWDEDSLKKRILFLILQCPSVLTYEVKTELPETSARQASG